MAFASYAALLPVIRDWLARPGDTTTLPDERLGELVIAAETEIYDRYKGRELEATATLTVSAQSVALPTDFIETRRLYLTGTPIRWLEYVSPPQFWREFAANVAGQPRKYTVEGLNLRFGPTPDATYTGALAYWSRPATLSSAVPTLFTARPMLYLYGCLAHAMPLVGNDERLPVWRGAFEAQLAQAQMASDRGAYGAAPMSMRPG